MARSTAFRILLVCSANLCRSPMTEYLLSAALSQRWGVAQAGWVIESVGVNAQPDLPIHPRAAAALLSRGIDASAFRSRRMSEKAVDSADLVLTASRDHRAAVVTKCPDAVHRTFTLRGFAHLTSGLPELQEASPTSRRHAVTAGHALVEAARRQRSRVQPLDPAQEDLIDPIGRRASAFRKRAGEIEQATAAILTPLTSPDSELGAPSGWRR